MNRERDVNNAIEDAAKLTGRGMAKRRDAAIAAAALAIAHLAMELARAVRKENP